MIARRILLWFLVVALVCPTLSPATAVENSRQSYAEKRATRKALGMYRRARRNLDTKADAVQMAGQVGPEAVEQMLGLIEDELKPQLERYKQQFLKAARAAAAAKYQAANMQEVEALRAKVLALRDDPNLTKEMIKQTGDPAMMRLHQLMILEPEAVLSTNRRLVEEREKMAGVGTLWEMCQKYLAKAESKMPVAGNAPAKKADAKEAITGGSTWKEFLSQEETIALRMALPMSDQTREVLNYNEKFASKLDGEEYRCLLALNLTRILLGIEPLKVDLKLTEAARGHSSDMVEHDFFSHTSPVPGKSSFVDRAKLAGASASGENIAYGSRKGHDTNLQWFHSPGHHRNMLADHKRVGIGRVRTHWTELFGR